MWGCRVIEEEEEALCIGEVVYLRLGAACNNDIIVITNNSFQPSKCCTFVYGGARFYIAGEHRAKKFGLDFNIQVMLFHDPLVHGAIKPIRRRSYLFLGGWFHIYQLYIVTQQREGTANSHTTYQSNALAAFSMRGSVMCGPVLSCLYTIWPRSCANSLLVIG